MHPAASVVRLRLCLSRPGALGLGLAPAAEYQAAERETEAERPDREASDRDRLPPGRQALPAAESLFFLGRERLTATLLTSGSAGAEPQIHVVENLGGLVHHSPNYSLPP
jgi:hypothetical protein